MVMGGDEVKELGRTPARGENAGAGEPALASERVLMPVSTLLRGPA
jgi:hypothetical protein